MLSQSSNLSSIEKAICQMLQMHEMPFPITSLSQLGDGRVFYHLLLTVPQFELTRPICDEDNLKLPLRLQNLKILTESMRQHLQKRLQRDASFLVVDGYAELATGTPCQAIKYLEWVVAVVLASSARGSFLEKAQKMPLQSQEMFLSVIKNAMAVVPDKEKHQQRLSSPSRARTLLERIDQLETQVEDGEAQLDTLKKQLEDVRQTARLQKEELARMREENSSLVDELSQLKTQSQIENERDSSARRKSLSLQQRLDIERATYEHRIQQQDKELMDAECRMEELRAQIRENKELQKNCHSANKRLSELEESMTVNYTMLQEKDSMINVYREKRRQDRDRIISLEREVEELQGMIIAVNNRKNTQQSQNNRSYEEPSSTYRDRRSLGNEFSDVVQEMKTDHNRVLTELAQEHLEKERDYEDIILKQREKIKFLEGLLSRKQNKENDQTVMNTTGKKINKQSNQSPEITQVSRALQEQHRQEVGVLIDMIGALKRDNEELRKQAMDELRLKEIRHHLYSKRLDAMFA